MRINTKKPCLSNFGEFKQDNKYKVFIPLIITNLEEINMIKINKKEVTGKCLYKKACDLTDIQQELQTITDYFDHINYAAKQGNKFVLNHFVDSGSFGNTIDVLQRITKAIGCISNDICPDEAGDSDD